MRRVLRRGGGALALDAVLALAVLSLAVAAPWHAPAPAPRLTATATGAVRLTNSRAGQAVFDGRNLRPGDEASGTVSIGNPGSAPLAVTLSGAVTGDAAGAGGTPLGFHVHLDLLDVTRSPAVVFSGPAASLRSLPLGTFAPHETRRYELRAGLPDGGDSANAFQGATLTTAFTWTATAVATAPTPAPSPTPVPVATPAPAAPQPAVNPASVIRFPRRLSRGRLTVRLVAPAGRSIRAVRVRVGRGKARRYGSVTRVRLDLRKRHGRFAVSVTATLSDGSRVTLKRSYRRR